MRKMFLTWCWLDEHDEYAFPGVFWSIRFCFWYSACVCGERASDWLHEASRGRCWLASVSFKWNAAFNLGAKAIIQINFILIHLIHFPFHFLFHISFAFSKIHNKSNFWSKWHGGFCYGFVFSSSFLSSWKSKLCLDGN